MYGKIVAKTSEALATGIGTLAVAVRLREEYGHQAKTGVDRCHLTVFVHFFDCCDEVYRDSSGGR
jgi:hypothetical protein